MCRMVCVSHETYRKYIDYVHTVRDDVRMACAWMTSRDTYVLCCRIGYVFDAVRDAHRDSHGMSHGMKTFLFFESPDQTDSL